MKKIVFVTQMCLFLAASYILNNNWGISVTATFFGIVLLNLLVFQSISVIIYASWLYRNPGLIGLENNKIAEAISIFLSSLIGAGSSVHVIRDFTIEGPHIELMSSTCDKKLNGLINSRKAFEFAATLGVPLDQNQKKLLSRCFICSVFYYIITILCIVLPGILPFRNAFVENCNKIKYFIKEFDSPHMYKVKKTIPVGTIEYIKAMSKILAPSYKSLPPRPISTTDNQE